MSTTQKLRTKTIDGYNVYLHEGDFNMTGPNDGSSLVSRSLMNPQNVVLFSRVVFGDDRAGGYGGYNDNRLTRRVGVNRIVDPDTEDTEEEIDVVGKPGRPDFLNIVDLRKIRQLIDRERSLIVPRGVKDNVRSPWELVIFDPNILDEKSAKYTSTLNTSNTSNASDTSKKSDPLDEILASLNEGDLVSGGGLSDAFIKPSKSLARCSYHESNLDTRPVFSDVYASKTLMLEGIFYKDVPRFRSMIHILFANAIIEKVVSKINTDVKGIQGLNPKSFWNSTVYDDLRASFEFLEKRSSNSFVQHHPDAPHKGYLLDTLATIIELMRYDPQLVMKMCSRGVAQNGVYDEQYELVDGFGVSKYLLNHPFLFYCVVNDKIQMYKFFVTKLTPSTIEYELYQIDTLGQNVATLDNVSINIRPKIITRNISDKFSFGLSSPDIKSGSKSESKPETKKLVIDYNKSFVNVTHEEIATLNDTVFQKVNSYINYIASIVGIVINDATRCVKAFIGNSKKIKVDFEPIKVTHTVFNDVLNELQLISDARTDTGSALCESTDQVEINKEMCRVLKNKIAPNLDSAVSTNDSYIKSKLYSTYHPLSYLAKLMSSHVITKGGTYTESNFVPLFTNREFFKKIVTKQDGVGKGSIVHKRVVDTVTMKDIVFSSDGSVYHHMNGFAQSDGSKIIIDLHIRSNCRLKLYARVENNCQLIGEGESIYVPIVYTDALNSVFIKLDSNPDEIIESLVRSNVPPFIKTSYVSLNTSSDVDDAPNGFITECISNYGKKNQYATSTLYVDREVDSQKRLVYFGTINSKSHFDSIEKVLFD